MNGSCINVYLAFIFIFFLIQINRNLNNKFKFSAKVGGYGKSWKLSSTPKNIGSSFSAKENEYFKTTTGDNATITVKKSGKYFLFYKTFAFSENGAARSGVYVNGTNNADFQSGGYSYGGTGIYMTASGVIELKANQKVEVRIWKPDASHTVNATGSDSFIMYNL